MALTPDDIVNHEFRQALRGYAINEVDDLLDRLADQVERSEQDLADLRQRLDRAEAGLAEARASESALERALVTAELAAQGTLEEAGRRADAIVDDAERAAGRMLEGARLRADEIAEQADRERQRLRASDREAHERAAASLAELTAIEQRYRAALRGELEARLAELEALGPSAPPSASESADREGPDS